MSLDDSWLDDIAALNEAARELLTGAPAECPPVGSWVRLFQFHPKTEKTLPASPWHQVEGWDDRRGYLSTVCARKGHAMIALLLARRRWARHFSFKVVDRRPARGVCQKCAATLDRAHQKELEAQAALDEHLREVRAEGALWAMRTLGIKVDEAAPPT